VVTRGENKADYGPQSSYLSGCAQIARLMRLTLLFWFNFFKVGHIKFKNDPVCAAERLMPGKSSDPFGGIRGEARKESGSVQLDPFEVDYNDALDGIQKSIDLWDGKGPGQQTRGTLIERFRQRAKQKAEDPPNWAYVNEFDKESADVYLRWSGRTIRTQHNIPRKEVRVALVGLLAFYKSMNPQKPDLSHPDVIRCYNLTMRQYGLQEAEYPLDLAFNPEHHLDPFAGIRGRESMVNSQFLKDLNRAIEETIFSTEFLDQLDVPAYRKEYRFKKRKPLNLKQTYKTSNSYFDVMLWWPGGPVQTVENVPVKRARIAVVSMRSFLEAINAELPDLKDDMVRQLYERSIEHHKPGQRLSDHPGLKPIEEGGYSYWSKLSHRWIKGRLDKKNNVFVPPEKGL